MAQRETGVIKANTNTVQAWSEAEQSLIRSTSGTDLSTEEFKLFLYISNKKGLNPLANEIWPVKYGGKNAKMVMQTSIEGYIKLATQTGKFGGFGQATAVVRNSEGKLEEIPLTLFDPENHELIRCIARVFHKDYSLPQEYHADYSFYCKKYDGKPNQFWDTGALHMLYKCAQANALRRTFASDGLGGMYIPEEMEQAKSERANAINVEYSEVEPSAPEEIFKKWNEIEKFLESKKVPPAGMSFAYQKTCENFNVSELVEITNVDALRKWARTGLLIELQKENFLPQ